MMPDTSAAFLVARLGLAMLFTASGVGKAMTLTDFTTSVQMFGVPRILVRPIALLVPLAELVLAAALLPAVSAPMAACALVVLLSAFTMSMIRLIYRGDQADCRCFGGIVPQAVGWQAVARNVGLMTLASVVWLQPGGAWTGAAVVAAGGVVLSTMTVGGKRHRAGRGSRRRHGRSKVAGGFSATTLTGETVTLTSLLALGRPVLLIFVHPGCAPCAQLLPEAATWQRRHKRSFTLIFVAGGSDSTLRRFFAGSDPALALVDPDRALAMTFGIGVTPSSVLITSADEVPDKPALGAPAIRALVDHVLARSDVAPEAVAPPTESPGLTPASLANVFASRRQILWAVGGGLAASAGRSVENAVASVARFGRRTRGIQLVSPARGVARGYPVPITLRFPVPVARGTFTAEVNGKPATGRFTVGTRTATALLQVDSGVRVGHNQLQVSVGLQADPLRTGITHYRTAFDLTVESPAGARTAALVPPAGRTIVLPELISVAFPAGAFDRTTEVTVAAEHDPAIDALFRASEGIDDVASVTRLPYELAVHTDRTQPLTDVSVSVSVPAAFRRTIAPDHVVGLFAETFWESSVETLDAMTPVAAGVGASEPTVSAQISRTTFTSRGELGDVSLVLLVGALASAAGPAASVSVARVASGGVCDGHMIDPPLGGQVQPGDRFGPRVDPVTGQAQFHQGVDIPVPSGTPIYAVADGTVVQSGYQANGAGYYMDIADANGGMSWYFHLQQGSTLPVGTNVEAGDQIALSDNSGKSTGPHLHFQYAPGGRQGAKVDPLQCFCGVVNGTQTNACGGHCVDLATDPTNCGTCGNTCDSNQCVNGKCYPTGQWRCQAGPDCPQTGMLYETELECAQNCPSGGLACFTGLCFQV